MEARRSGHHLDVLLGGAVLERELILGHGANHVEEEPAGQHDAALALDRRLRAHPDPELHVGGLELEAIGIGSDQHPGQSLDRATGGRPAHGDAESGQKGLARG
ncbi:MAG: hypothetical protein WKF31_08995 [Thermoleophilaceae bacterium]